MQAVILSAGFGTRLGELTKDTPKALLSVNNRPVIEYIIKKLEAVRPQKINIVTNELYYPKFVAWLQEYDTKTPLIIVSDKTRSEKEKLGAVGDLRFILEKERIDDDVLLLVSDMLFSFSLKGFISTANKRKRRNLILLYRLKNIAQACNYGVALLDKNNRVLKFEEKPAQPISALIAFGAYYLPKCKLGMVGKFYKTRYSKDALGSYFNWLCREDSLYGFIQDRGYWGDVGADLNHYRETDLLVKKRRNF
ncbi:MAG: nucleotidyltransferase family protein [Candidatus Omnitrophica bacterium]|nr:nucleotidyltransferase family protein [Candidatus Omnitrophota bacterium]